MVENPLGRVVLADFDTGWGLLHGFVPEKGGGRTSLMVDGDVVGCKSEWVLCLIFLHIEVCDIFGVGGFLVECQHILLCDIALLLLTVHN